MNLIFRFGWKTLIVLCIMIALPLVVVAQDTLTQVVDLGDDLFDFRPVHLGDASERRR